MELFLNSVFDLEFSSTVKLSEPIDIGIDAKEFVYASQTNGIDDFVYLTFVKFDFEAQKNMNMSDSELLNYVKSTFLGTTKQTENYKERQILGSKSIAEVIETKIPTHSVIEIHLITLTNNVKFAISFKSKITFDKKELDFFIQTITSSLHLKT